MFISVLELLKIGIGPSSSHTLGPLLAANTFINTINGYLKEGLPAGHMRIKCTLKGSLAFTGKGHATDRAIALGLHGYQAKQLAGLDVDQMVKTIWQQQSITIASKYKVSFAPADDIVFDYGQALTEHPNGMIFSLEDTGQNTLITETYFSIGGGFISTVDEIKQLVAPLAMHPSTQCLYPFDTAKAMLTMAAGSGLSIAQMKRANELAQMGETELQQGLDEIWQAMTECIQCGLSAEGTLPGKIHLARRAKGLHQQLLADTNNATVNDWLSAYAMAVNEENAAGHRVVTAPTNGAAGVIPAVLYYFVNHEGGTQEQVREFLLTAAAIGGLIKHKSSISGAEVGCQGEVGSAAAMAAAGLCAVRGGTPEKIENAAEIALEHHLGMTCDPVAGLVQVPCIERNAFGAIKAYAAASLAYRGSGQHFMPLDSCIAAMKQTGFEMSEKYKETSLGGLAVSLTEC